jgi:hypothetical protein
MATSIPCSPTPDERCQGRLEFELCLELSAGAYIVGDGPSRSVTLARSVVETKKNLLARYIVICKAMRGPY